MTKYLFLIIWFLGCSSTEVKKPLSIGFWNIENLFDLIDDPNKRDDEFSLNGRKNVTKEVYDLKINNSAKVLFDLNVDVLGLCEVENINVLEDLNEAYKERNYKIIHYDSPDERGIDNALMYDENQFSIIESRPIKNIIKKGDRTRDILYVKGLYDRELLHLFINHWPSNYGGKESAIPKRMSTANLLINEISMIKEEDQDAEIILLGDFNENPDDKNIELLSSVGLYSLMKPMIKIPKKGIKARKPVKVPTNSPKSKPMADKPML